MRIQPTKYTGPAKPIQTYKEPITHKAERVVFLLGLVVVALDVLLWRP